MFKPSARWVTSTVAIAACAIPMAGLAYGAAGESPRTDSAPSFRHDVAGQLAGLTAGAPDISGNEINALREMIRPVPENSPVDVGPALSQMEPLESGRELYAGENGRMVGVASKRGDVCYVVSRDAAFAVAGCVQTLGKSGVHVSIESRANRTFWLNGLAADGVTSVTVNTRDGGTEKVDLGRNAFVWKAKSFTEGALPTSLTVVRGGETYEQDVPVDPGVLKPVG